MSRYIELAGLVRDGRMVNKDKENRAREYIKRRANLISQIPQGEKISRNTKYGDLIIQANRVQYYLIKLILLRSLDPSKEFEKSLIRSQLGHLIGYFRVCAQTKEDLDLAGRLKDYKDKRDALAHKMFTASKLSLRDCKSAIRSGDVIIRYMVKALKEKPRMLKQSDKLSEFPKQYNKLVNVVKMLEKRVVELEKRL